MLARRWFLPASAVSSISAKSGKACTSLFDQDVLRRNGVSEPVADPVHNYKIKFSDKDEQELRQTKKKGW